MSNVVFLNADDGRRVQWEFPDGTVVTIEVPLIEPPITVKHSVYCFSALLHRTHTEMEAHD